MAVKRFIIYGVEIEDRPGSLQKLLAQAASKNVDLQCFEAFSAGGGRGGVYINAKDPKAFESFIEDAGIEATPAVGFLVSGKDKVGAAAEVLKKLADAGINGVAGSAMVCDGNYQMLIVVLADDGDVAAKALGA